MSATEHPARLEVSELLAQCETRRQRRSGPGGQHRNKVETAVAITHSPTGCIGEASERRSQEQNRQEAIQRLRVQLALDVRANALDQPSELWQQRMTSRQRVNPAHEDFPTLLSEALDVLAACDWNAATAAKRLECSTSSFVKLLKGDYRALEQLNKVRRDNGLRELK